MGRQEELVKEAKKIFLKQFGGISPLPMTYFHTFLCPVALAEAMVKEHIVEDYGALELLVLRLYDAGFKSVDELASLSGMGKSLIERVLNNEIYVYQHIGKDGKLTEMGQKTLQENDDGRSVSHMMYDTPRRMQIEAATGTVIPSYLEMQVEFMKAILPDSVDGIVPRESVQYDEELCKEINMRLQEYKHMGILNAGDTIVSVEKLQSRHIFYRWAYLVKFEGMSFPMIVMNGLKTIDNVGVQKIKKGDYGKKVVEPLAIARTDAAFLKSHGIVFDNVIIREDNAFEYLRDKIESFAFGEIVADIDEDIQEVVYEDEKTNETMEMYMLE